jgi:hypothetical protein
VLKQLYILSALKGGFVAYTVISAKPFTYSVITKIYTDLDCQCYILVGSIITYHTDVFLVEY